MDQGFHYSKAVTQMWGELTRAYADSPVIPFKVEDYAKFLSREFQYIKDTYGQKLEANGITLEYFGSAVANFSSQATRFQQELDSIDTDDPFTLRNANDRLLRVERSFLDPKGLPDRPEFK
jgi:N-acetylated-alpha-linked acidic dipeptidase